MLDPTHALSDVGHLKGRPVTRDRALHEPCDQCFTVNWTTEVEALCFVAVGLTEDVKLAGGLNAFGDHTSVRVSCQSPYRVCGPAGLLVMGPAGDKGAVYFNVID